MLSLSFCSLLLLFAILSIVCPLIWLVGLSCLGSLGHGELELLLIVKARVAYWLIFLPSHGYRGLHWHWEHLGKLRWLL